MNPTRRRAAGRIAALLVFGLAFGYLEAAVVSYLRTLHEPVRQHYYPVRPPDDLFPLLTLDQVRAAAPQTMKTIAVEVGREAATLVMLAAIAWAVADSAGEWAAAFAISFGVWDIAFYLFLKLLLDWPASLFTWDVLFLIPVPWVGPVLAPVLVAAAMIATGVWHLQRESGGERVRVELRHWSGIAFGALVIVVSFTMDWRNIMAGGMPRPFHWPLFGAGLAIGLASYAAAANPRRGR